MNRRTFALAGVALLPATTAALAQPKRRAADTTRAKQDAEARRTKKKNKQPTTKIVTRTFSNGQRITMPDKGPAAPYPATIKVRGLTNGRILDVNLKLRDFNHTAPNEVDLLLVAPDGRAALVMSDVGDDPVSDLTITLDDQAGEPLPRTGTLTSGTFQPTNHVGASDDIFPAPAPQGVSNPALSVFRGANPNGTWQLFVVDQVPSDRGSISDGWSLTIKARVKTRR